MAQTVTAVTARNLLQKDQIGTDGAHGFAQFMQHEFAIKGSKALVNVDRQYLERRRVSILHGFTGSPIMFELIFGLLLFLGVHSTRIFADPWRTAMRQRLGPGRWKGLYTLVSLLGLGLLIYGWGQARLEPVVLWQVPRSLKHLAALLTLVAFVFFVAAYVPGNSIKARLHHPMVLGTKAWALAHLVSNNTVADLVLFGAFLAWSTVLFVVSRRRDRLVQAMYQPGRFGPTVLTVAFGVLLWAAFALWLHGFLIGVRPLG